jgi:hypothetical protein
LIFIVTVKSDDWFHLSPKHGITFLFFSSQTKEMKKRRNEEIKK